MQSFLIHFGRWLKRITPPSQFRPLTLLFATSYLCETGFNVVAVLKTKFRSRLIMEKELHVAISSTPPRFEKLRGATSANITKIKVGVKIRFFYDTNDMYELYEFNI